MFRLFTITCVCSRRHPRDVLLPPGEGARRADEGEGITDRSKRAGIGRLLENRTLHGRTPAIARTVEMPERKLC